MPLEISSREKEQGVLVVSPVGSIDSNTYKILQSHLDSILSESCPEVIVFDMDGVNFISSMGIRVILKTRKWLKQKGGKVFMANLRPQIKVVFDIIRALPPERIFASIEELDDYLGHMQRRTLEEG